MFLLCFSSHLFFRHSHFLYIYLFRNLCVATLFFTFVYLPLVFSFCQCIYILFFIIFYSRWYKFLSWCNCFVLTCCQSSNTTWLTVQHLIRVYILYVLSLLYTILYTLCDKLKSSLYWNWKSLCTLVRNETHSTLENHLYPAIFANRGPSGIHHPPIRRISNSAEFA